jgi:large subunit ribosomal protein L35
MTKTRKSISKRFKVTKKGKLLKRTTGLNHFLAKKPSQKIRDNRKLDKLYQGEIKRIKRSNKIPK